MLDEGTDADKSLRPPGFLGAYTARHEDSLPPTGSGFR
jgi:hypothetical protein